MREDPGHRGAGEDREGGGHTHAGIRDEGEDVCCSTLLGSCCLATKCIVSKYLPRRRVVVGQWVKTGNYYQVSGPQVAPSCYYMYHYYLICETIVWFIESLQIPHHCHFLIYAVPPHTSLLTLLTDLTPHTHHTLLTDRGVRSLGSS